MSRSESADANRGESGVRRALASFVFIAIVAILAARGLLPESFDWVEISFLEQLDTGGTSPATIVYLDTLLLVLCALGACVAPSRQITVGGVIVAGAFVALLAAVIISSGAAAEHRIAVTAGTNLLVTALCGLTLLRLIRAEWMLRLLLAVALATAGANAVKCVLQRTSEFGQTLEVWEQQKQELFRNGYSPDDPGIANYESRMRSQLAFGYHYHPNIAGSNLMLPIIAGAGLLLGLARAARARRYVVGQASLPARRSAVGQASLPAIASREAGSDARSSGPNARSTKDSTAAPFAGPLLATGAILAFLTIGLALTGSKGAFDAGAIGLLTMSLLGTRSLLPLFTPGRTLALFIAGYALLVLLGIGYALTHGTLPGASLAFRWEYWRAAAWAYFEHPLTGIGRENFADAFLLFRSPSAVEDVTDPHNLWASLLVELGPLGLSASAILLLATLAAALRRSGHPTRHSAAAPSGTPAHPTQPAKPAWRRHWHLATAVIILAIVHGASNGLPLSNWNVAFVWLVDLVGAWALGLIAVDWALSAALATTDGRRWLAAALSAALIASLMHGLVDFALMTPAGIAMFVTLAASAAALARHAQTGIAPNSGTQAGGTPDGGTLDSSAPDGSTSGSGTPDSGPGRPPARSIRTPTAREGPADASASAAPPPAARHVILHAHDSRRAVFAPALSVAIALALFVALGTQLWSSTVPVARGAFQLHRMQTELRQATSPDHALAALQYGIRAANADLWDAHAPRATAMQALRLAADDAAPPTVQQAALRLAHTELADALDRNPRSAAALHLQALTAELEYARALRAGTDSPTESSPAASSSAATSSAASSSATTSSAAGSPAPRTAARRAALAWTDAVGANPVSPHARRSTGHAWLRLARLGDRDAAILAASHLDYALWLDAQRTQTQTQRLRPQELSEIRAWLDELRAMR